MGTYLDSARRAAKNHMDSRDRLTALASKIEGTSDLGELFAVMEVSQAMFEAGEISQKEVVELAVHADERSRHVPVP